MALTNKLAFVVGVLSLIAGIKYMSYPSDIVQPTYKVFAIDLLTKFSFRVVEKIVHFVGIDKGDPITWRQNQQENARKVAQNDEPGFEIKWMQFGSVKVLYYLPTMRSSLGQMPAVMYYHGGGWTFFNPDFYDQIWTRPLARKLGNETALFSVEYRKPPLNPYPAALDDCVSAFKYLVEHAAEFNVDPKRIAIMGDSAGGNLAAAVALKLKKTGSRVMPKLQLLIYPVLQAFDFQSPSMFWTYDIVLDVNQLVRLTLVYVGEPVESYTSAATIAAVKANNHTSMSAKKKYRYLFAHNYLSETFKAPDHYKPFMAGYENMELAKRLEKKILDPLAFPLMASLVDLESLPQAYIITSQYDVLRDHGILYADRLKQANVKVVHRNIEGGYHGIMNMIGVLEFPAVMAEVNLMTKYLRNNL